jgi:hypothetical protein
MAEHHEEDPLAFAVRKVFGRLVSAGKIEALRIELVRTGVIARDGAGQSSYDPGPPRWPLH